MFYLDNTRVLSLKPGFTLGFTFLPRFYPRFYLIGSSTAQLEKAQ